MITEYNKYLTIMRKQFYFLLLSVLLSIPVYDDDEITDEQFVW